jgi:hypothetical protein
MLPPLVSLCIHSVLGSTEAGEDDTQGEYGR